MIGPAAQAASAIVALNPVSAANTAAATSAWIDVRQYEGDIVFVQASGALTGSITGGIEDATDGAGTGAAAMTPNEGAYTLVNSANAAQRRSVNANATRGWVRYVGTIVTGPCIASVVMLATPKSV